MSLPWIAVVDIQIPESMNLKGKYLDEVALK